ncbi:MAG: cytochrome b562 [Cephaloticoccus sp.]
MRKLRRQVTTAELNAESRAQVAIMLEAAAKARALTPEKTADLPEADRPAFVAGYQAQIDKLLESLRDLDAALAAGDNAAAADLVRGLRGIQREGHKEYQKEKDRD